MKRFSTFVATGKHRNGLLGEGRDGFGHAASAIVRTQVVAKTATHHEGLVAEKEADPTLFTKEEFFRMVDEAKQDIANGKGRSFSNPDEMNAWLNSL